MKRLGLASVLLTAVMVVAGAITRPAVLQVPAAATESAYRANNLGVARLEQFDYEAAASSFRQALQLDPALHTARLNLGLALFYANSPDAALQEARAAAERLPASPHVHYLLGLLARAQNHPEDAVTAFRRVLQHDPVDVGTKVNLGQVYLQQRNFDEAVRLFREALDSEPYNVTAAYNLATALTRSGAAEEGKVAMQRFQALRDSTYGTTYAQTYLAQGKYAEALASTGAEPELVSKETPAVTFADATPAALTRSRGTVPLPLAGDVPPMAAALSGSVTLFDADGDSDLDLLEAGPKGLRLYQNERGTLTDATGRIGRHTEAGGFPIAGVAADYDNDTRPDLFVLRSEGNQLLRQQPDGQFDDVTEAARIAPYPHLARSVAFVDLDHDGDLDLFVVGFTGPNQLLRNNGNSTFTDVTAEARVAGSSAKGIAVVPSDFDNRRDMDLLVVSQDRAPTLFQNVRDGSFRDAAAEAGLPRAATYSTAAAADVNKDGYVDVFFGKSDGPGVLAMSDGSGRFGFIPGPDAGAVASQFVDYDNDGLLDLFVLTERSARLFRNVGGRWTETTESAGLNALTARAASFQAMAFGDLDGDGDTDAVVRLSNSELRYWRNEGGNRNQSFGVRLAGRVSNRNGVGSKIELRAGSLRQRLESSAVTPAVAPADLLFGLGSRAAADVVRVLWPSGTVQAEVDFGTPPNGSRDVRNSRGSVITVTELDRKPSSCPYLYTWNGSRFEFVTDFMGGGELGYWLGPGKWSEPDPDEYVRIRGEQLKPRDGRYELRVTNELEEVTFVDRVQLVAVDHPVSVEIYPNEGMGRPRIPFGITTTRHARPVAGARDEHGHDVAPLLESMDRRYPDDFTLSSIRGYAAPHVLTLDLGAADARRSLLMTGWTDYAFSGDNVAAYQSGRTLSPPSLQVKDASGVWRTAIENIGIPVGRPQTVVVFLEGIVPRSTREVRILTNMRIYWDQIQVDSSEAEVETVLTRVDPALAELRWRGFSEAITPDGREPYRFDYERVSAASPWKVMTGRYTREGDVRSLLTARGFVRRLSSRRRDCSVV